MIGDATIIASTIAKISTELNSVVINSIICYSPESAAIAHLQCGCIGLAFSPASNSLKFHSLLCNMSQYNRLTYKHHNDNLHYL